MSDKAWGWWASRDGENYTVGPFDTREEVIRVATDDFDAEPFWITEAVQAGVEGLMPDAQRIIEDALERAADDGVFGEDGDFDLTGKPDKHKQAFGELDAALHGWFANWKHLFPRPWAFADTRNSECIDPTTLETAEGNEQP